MDIVERLLSYRPPYGWPEEYSIIVEPTLNHVAANEIEQLRKVLKDVLETSEEQIPYGTVKAIRTALKVEE